MTSSYALELVIGTSTNTQYLTPNSVLLYDNLDARTALSFQLRMPTSATRPTVGQPVFLAKGTEGSTAYIFGGTLDNYSESVLNPLASSTNTYNILYCNAVDFTQMLNKRLVFKSYVSSGLGEYDLVATTESRTGDGATRTWAMAYPLSTIPTVNINGFAASVGTFGVSASTFGYYYTPSSFLILGNTSNNAPASSDTITVIYSAIIGKSAYDSDIIRDINTNFFNGEGINCSSTLGYVIDGVRIPEINYNYVAGNEAINTICDITGYSWYIDPWKNLHYFPREENAAPFSIGSTSNNWRSLTVKRSRDKYRNKEYVLGSYAYFPTTESFKGDGVTKTWALSYPLYDQPTVLVDGYKATVAVVGAASTYGYYWQKESNQLIQNSSNNALASTDSLTVIYNGLYPVVAVAADGDEISTRAAIEGNSGIYENANESNKTYLNTSAIYYGHSILDKYGKPLDQVEFETDVDGLKSGQLIKITYPNNNLDDYYYIISVTARDVDKALLRYKVVAVSGTDRGGWVSFFRSLVNGTNSIYTEPYINLVQTTLISGTGNVHFKDSGITVTVSYLVIALYDTAVYDTGVYT